MSVVGRRVRWKVEESRARALEGKRCKRCQGKREVSAGDAAITGMVEDEKHRWRQEGGGEGGWRAADAGRDMLYDVCSSHRPSLIN